KFAAAGQRAPAISILQQLIIAAPAHIAARSLLGTLLHEQGSSIEALQVLDAGVELAPGDPALHELRAPILLALGQPAAAAQAARSALARGGRRPRALFSLAAALAAQQRGEESMAALRSLLDVDPRHRPARLMLVRILLRNRQPQQALALALDPGVIADESV